MATAPVRHGQTLPILDAEHAAEMMISGRVRKVRREQVLEVMASLLTEVRHLRVAGASLGIQYFRDYWGIEVDPSGSPYPEIRHLDPPGRPLRR